MARGCAAGEVVGAVPRPPAGLKGLRLRLRSLPGLAPLTPAPAGAVGAVKEDPIGDPSIAEDVLEV